MLAHVAEGGPVGLVEKMVAGMVSGTAGWIAQGAEKMMVMTKMKVVAVGVVMLAGFGGLGIAASQEAQPAPATSPVVPKDTAPATTSPATSDADQAAMQGEWSMVRVEHDGQAVHMNGVWTVTIQGNQMRFDMGSEGKQNSTFSLDASKRPKWIDLTPSDYPEVMPGIYEMKGAELWIAQWNKRPASFEETSTAKGILLVLRRGNPRAPANAK